MLEYGVLVLQIVQRSLERLCSISLLLELCTQIPYLGFKCHHALLDTILNLGTSDGDGVCQLDRGGGCASLRLCQLHLELALAFTRSLQRCRQRPDSSAFGRSWGTGHGMDITREAAPHLVVRTRSASRARYDRHSRNLRRGFFVQCLVPLRLQLL